VLSVLKSYTFSQLLPDPYHARRGVVLEWADGMWTEASPLPGFSKDSIEEVLQAIEAKNFKAPLPSLQFALERLEEVKEPLAYCGLLLGDPEAMLKQASDMRHAKLKLKGIDFKAAIALTKELSKKMMLRIDFNRSLDLEEALFFAKECESDAIEFYEEPLKNPHELQYFPFPIALDETLREKGFESLSCLPQVAALVIKPTMTGNLRACKAYEQFRKPIVLSACFESGVGIAQILRFAPHFKSLLALGIDTYRYLKNDLLETPLRFENGFCYPPEKIDVRRALLS
jgi:O-succinylbenzoate synthase